MFDDITGSYSRGRVFQVQWPDGAVTVPSPDCVGGKWRSRLASAGVGYSEPVVGGERFTFVFVFDARMRGTKR